MKILKRVDKTSFAKTYGMFGMALGLIIGVLTGLVALVMPSSENGGIITGLLIIILVPVFYGIMGFVFGYIGVLIWNFVLKLSGGIKLQLEDEA